jgi:hypothetical protein
MTYTLPYNKTVTLKWPNTSVAMIIGKDEL